MRNQFSMFGKWGVSEVYNPGEPAAAAPAASPTVQTPAPGPIGTPAANPAAPQPPPAAHHDPFFDNRGVQGATYPPDAPPAAPAPVAQPENPESALLNPGPAVADAAATPTAPAGTPLGARAAAAALGYQAAGQFQDDNTFIQTLMQAAVQGEQYRQHLLRMQQAPAQPAAPAAAPQPAAPAAPAKPWQGPEWNPSWNSLIVKGADGSVGLVPGADPTLLPKYHAYEAHRRSFADKLIADPESILGPMIDARAKALAEDQVRQATAQTETKTFVEGFVRENTAWLHQRGTDGQVLRNPANGQPQLSVAGARFQAHCNQAQQMGIADIRAQAEYARTQLTNEYLLAQQTQAQQQADSTRQTVEANRRPSTAGVLPRAGQNVPAPAGGDLRDMLLAAFRENGITDAMLQGGNG